MTIVRQAQFTAETRILTDVAYFASAPVISSAQAKTGTYSYIMSYQRGPFGKALVAPLTAIRMGFWLYLTSSVIADDCYLYYGGYGKGGSESASQISFRIDTGTGELTLERPVDTSNMEVLDSWALPAQFATTGTWFHVGITHKVDASVGFIACYIDGVRVAHYEGDTRPAYSPGGLDQNFNTALRNVLGAGARGTSGTQGFNGAYIDDMYIDSYEGEADAPVPSRRFLMVLPTGAGADAEWTGVGSATNYQNVDENPNNGDSDYNKALSADLRDTFAMGDITVPVDHQIVAVLPSPFVKRLDSEVAHQISVHAWDGSIYGDSADLDLSMSYDVPVFARMTTQPDGSDWNEADFNAMQFGYRARGTF